MIRPLTVPEIAERWTCCERTVYQIIETGALRSFGVGRLIRVRPEWIEAYECGEQLPEAEGDRVLKLIQQRQQALEARSGTSRRTRAGRTLATGTGSGQGTR
jgi:excisionase family DNA binding protein